MQNTLFQNPFKILLLIVPVFALLIVGIPLVGVNDAMTILKWFLIIFIFGISFYPLSVSLFKNHLSGGFLLGSVAGILSIGLVIWTLAYMRLPVFNTWGIIVSLIALLVGPCLYKPLRSELIKKLANPRTLNNIVYEETVFAVVLVILCFFKGFGPMINGQEKLMDYGFIMSMLRSSTLPANDMWLSGYSINYYYFGQYIYTLLIKLSLIRPGIGYTLAMCTSIALPFAMCYSIGSYMIEVFKKNYHEISPAINHICGLLMGFAVTIFGNSHSFFYDPESVGNNFLNLLKEKNTIDVGNIDVFYYPNSTRFIGHNPDSAFIEGIKNGGDYTIEEFPFYSFLIGDLHAHVVSTMVVLLIIAVCIALINKVSSSLPGENRKLKNLYQVFSDAPDKVKSFVLSELKSTISIEIIIMGILLGIAQMTNYWDFLIYFIFCSMTLLVVSIRKSNVFSSIFGSFLFVFTILGILIMYLGFGDAPVPHILFQLIVLICTLLCMLVAPCALTRTALGMSIIFTLAHLVALPFNLNFDMISNKIALCVNHSSFFQLFILWCTHVLFAIVMVVFTVFHKNGQYDRTQLNYLYGQPRDGYQNVITKFFGERNIIDIFSCGMAVVGILLLIAPEIFYVRDIYTSGYLRSNTMFKFTYAGFIILSIVMAYTIVRLISFYFVDEGGNYGSAALSFLLCFTLLVPAHYAPIALQQRCGDGLKKENYKSLDGTAYLYDYASPYASVYETGNLSSYTAAINWFNDYVSGTPVIMESYGDSYTDYNIVSAYTGLPSVCGWQTHEWLWRFHGVVDQATNLIVSDPNHDVWELYLSPRHSDIATVYTSDNRAEVQSVLDKYNVEYVIIGDMERLRFYTDNTDVIASCGEIVFVTDDLVIVHINRQ